MNLNDTKRQNNCSSNKDSIGTIMNTKVTYEIAARKGGRLNEHGRLCGYLQ